MPIKKLELEGMNPVSPLNQVINEINDNLDALVSAIDSASAGDGVIGPQGLKGDKGDIGSIGPQGDKGDTGDRGEQGLQGIKGDKGDTGEKGDTGAKGDKGDKGDPGKDGVNGTNGLPGAKGDTGDKGDTGAKGTPGVVNTVTYTGPVTVVNSIGQTVAQTTFTSGGYPILCIANGDANPDGQRWIQLQWFRDGVAIGNKFHLESPGANINCHYNIITPDAPTAGAHTYSLRTVGVIAGSWAFGEGSGPQFIFVELAGASVTQPTVAPAAPATTAPAVGGPPVVGAAPNPTATTTPTVATAIRGYAAGYVDAGQFVTLDNLKFTVTTGGARGLAAATISGNIVSQISGTIGYVGGGGGMSTNGSWTITPTLSGSFFGWSFPDAGASCTCMINDTTNQRVYRVTMMIGGGYMKNFISIERLY